MMRTRLSGAVIVATCLTAAVGFAVGAAASSRWGAGYFPDVTLTTQDGVAVKFYDLIKGRIVAIDLIYTTCQYACPLETARLTQVQKMLGERMGADVFFLSITIDPEHDTPAVLKAYAEKYRTGPGWYFLTGSLSDIDLLSKKLGLYSEPNPDNKDGHAPRLLIGNEATGQWIHGSALDNPRFTATLISGSMSDWKGAAAGKSYAEAKPLATPGRGEYLFSTRCSACHTIGRGEKVGPDLAGVVNVRDRAWLLRYIATPEKLLSEGDPLARELFARYDGVRMPNLGLTQEEAAAIVDFVSSTAAKAGRGARNDR